MSDVARLAGVSHQTVSRVLNNHPSVSEATRQRVMRAVEQLGYRPNALARALASRRSRVLGVISFDITQYGPAATLRGIERAARAAGYALLMTTLERVEREAVLDAIHTLVDQSVVGIIFVAPQVSAITALYSLPRGLSVVAVEAGGGGVPVVAVDQRLGARLATEHLLELGHRSVWHISGPTDGPESAERLAGWRSALDAAGRRVPPVAEGDWSAQSGFVAAATLMRQPELTAVFCGNDQMALGLLRALQEGGRSVPDEVSVVGFDDIPEAGYFTPPLTTIRPDFDEIGRRSLAVLLDEVHRGPDEPPPLSPPRISPTLVVRASSGPPPRPDGTRSSR
jgi:LacI family transcriptional regulator